MVLRRNEIIKALPLEKKILEDSELWNEVKEEEIQALNQISVEGTSPGFSVWDV